MVSYRPSHEIRVRSLATNDIKHVITDDVVSFHTAKAYGRGSGQWQMELTAKHDKGNRWSDKLLPNDVVEIIVTSGAPNSKPVVVMKGLVDRVSLSRVVTADGRPQRTVRLSGQDMGKLLMSGEIGWNINAAQMQVDSGKNIMVNYLRRFKLTGGTPAKLVKEIFDITTKEVPTLAKHINCSDWLTTVDDWHVFNMEAYLMEQTPLWQAMKRFENPPWNILYCDTDDDGVFFVGLEEYPLDDGGRLNHDKSATLEVSDADIVSDDIGISDSDRVNLMALHTPLTTFVDQSAGIDFTLANPMTTMFDKDSIPVNGFIPHIFRTEYFPPGFLSRDFIGPPSPDVFRDIKSRVDIMWNWVKNNHTYYNGTMVLHGTPEVRAGWKLFHKETGRSYLIEQVSHEYSLFPIPKFITSLRLTRGQ